MGADRFDTMGLNKQVNILKPEHKISINMAYFSGFTQHEISKQLDVPLGTVKTRMRAAILELRKHTKYLSWKLKKLYHLFY